MTQPQTSREPTESQAASIFVRTLKTMMEDACPPVSQADIAFTLAMSPQYVCDVLKGRRHPFQAGELAKLSTVYGFDLTGLLTARAWVLRKIDLPPFATFKQVQGMVEQLMRKDTVKA
jgi:hypothetical protein